MRRDSLRIALTASRFGESFGVKPQVSHTVALGPPVPAFHFAALANEVFETWASPSLSPSLHQSQIAPPRRTPLRMEWRPHGRSKFLRRVLRLTAAPVSLASTPFHWDVRCPRVRRSFRSPQAVTSARQGGHFCGGVRRGTHKRSGVGPAFASPEWARAAGKRRMPAGPTPRRFGRYPPHPEAPHGPKRRAFAVLNAFKSKPAQRTENLI